MKSIRLHLLQNLLIGMVLIASITGIFIYRHVRHELDELYNAHLQQLALFMAREWDRVSPSQFGAISIKPRVQPIWEEENYLLQVWARDGTLLAQEVPAATTASIPLARKQGFYRKHIANESWKIYRADGVHNIVQIAQPESARHHTINETSFKLLMPLLLQVPLLMLVALLSVRRGLKPLDLLSQAIALRQPEALTAIDSVNEPLELQPLVTTLNDLLARLQGSLQQQRNFVADAAHELRTPIAALQLQLDLLARAKTSDDHTRAIAQLRNGLQRATHLTQQLLSIARAESSPDKSRHQRIDLPVVIETVIERYLPFAWERKLDLGVTRLESASIYCSLADIEAVLDNLVSNAIRYTPVGGRVDLALYCDQSDAIIEVSDSGPGISPEERHRVFDRFYRVLQTNLNDDSIQGSGLGLAIVKAICNRYSVVINISEGNEGNGTRFTVRWPLTTALN
jgi:two-component system, OmpR family, sensor kinase